MHALKRGRFPVPFYDHRMIDASFCVSLFTLRSIMYGSLLIIKLFVIAKAECMCSEYESFPCSVQGKIFIFSDFNRIHSSMFLAIKSLL